MAIRKVNGIIRADFILSMLQNDVRYNEQLKNVSAYVDCYQNAEFIIKELRRIAKIKED